ncbi:MAG: hydantoinase/oxoprolinase family protein, partial [Candidatus Bipolaricaulota bacterium]
AGADPGPACYRRGETQPTVTDAQLTLGRLPPEHALGGLPRLDVQAARAAVARVAEALGLSVDQAAWGILEVVESTMEQAIRVISVRRGVDPRGFTLLAFGGAGPLHGATLARKLGMRGVLYPTHAGALSALGLMGADLVLTYVRSVLVPWPQVQPQLLRQVLEHFRAHAVHRLATAGAKGSALGLQAAADIRYRGQGFELTVPLPTAEPSSATMAALAREFHHAHEAFYGYSAPEEPLELVNLRLTAVAPTDKPALPRVPPEGTLQSAARQPRPVYVDPTNGWTSCPVFDRRLLPAGAHLPAPAVVEGEDSTCFIPPGVSARVDALGNLSLEVS